MRIILGLALALAACGGQKSKPSTTSSPTGSAKPEAASTCCCELPSDPPTFEKQDSKTCHEDSHGVCKEDAKCTK